MILALQNDVFKAMFYGDFAKEDRIVITDLHPDGVRGLLRYFYSGNLEVANAHQAACTRTAAAKYLVPKLEEKCLSFVNARLGPMDVCPFLDCFLTMSEDELDSPAKALIRRDTLGVIGARNFPHSTERTVRYILRHATNVPEAIVVESVYDWAKQQWLTHFFEDDQRSDIRAVMLPLFPELRFLALTATEFVQGPIAWKIFTDAEALAILSNIIKGRSMAMPEGFSKIRKNRA
ncbi:BTB/POZ domain-containing protein 6-B-like [Rhipicephalus microplus]|uniref:BTB/POZ domain-containing protein 6-B-like n=1 Tax=Rhipicephalus microplus TaxID=6941 RepID=UPI003F6BFDAF